MQLKPLADQVVVVFGASSGIGRETALQLARRGARLVVAARSQPGLESLVDEIAVLGGEAVAVTADAAEYGQVQAVADQAVARFGRLDTWVHAAAVSLYATFEETSPAEFRRIIEVNLLGQVYGAMAALPYLKREGRGALIHVSSVEALRSLPYQSAYAAAKHGINGFTEALRVELQHDKIPVSVTTIMPASINTPLFDKARTRLGVKPKGIDPIYSPQDVAKAILFAAEHPKRDMIVGDAGRVISFVQRLSPSLMDNFLLATGFTGQKTDEPKSSDRPDNLYKPVEGYNQVEGSFKAMPSLTEWFDRNPVAAAVGGAMLGGVALLTLRALSNGRDR